MCGRRAFGELEPPLARMRVQPEEADRVQLRVQYCHTQGRAQESQLHPRAQEDHRRPAIQDQHALERLEQTEARPRVLHERAQDAQEPGLQVLPDDADARPVDGPVSLEYQSDRRRRHRQVS